MKLYHGTEYRRLNDIIEHGIVPRGSSGISNWDDAPSHPEMVYLTIAYPFWYCCHAQSDDEINIGLVFEIDADKLDTDLLFPDEDFVSQANAGYNNHKKNRRKKKKTTDVLELRDSLFGYQHHWNDSLTYLGNCCHLGTIPVDAITRYCTVDFNNRKNLEMTAVGPCVNTENFLTRGDYYKNLVAWFFGDRALLPGVDEAKPLLSDKVDTGNLPKGIQDVLNGNMKRYKVWMEESGNREGIDVVVL